MTSGTRSSTGGAAQVAEAQVEQLRDARALGLLAADLEHPRRRVDADHADARRRDRHRDPPGADAELDDRPAATATASST